MRSVLLFKKFSARKLVRKFSLEIYSRSLVRVSKGWNMRFAWFIGLVTSCFLAGMLFFAFYNGWIIIAWPKVTRETIKPVVAQKKKIDLFFWIAGHWQRETTEIVWSDESDQNIYRLVNRWLLFLHEEHFMTRQINVQNVLLATRGNEVYLSFDNIPFEKQFNIRQKWFWVESLLKTIRENDIKLQAISILVHHQPLYDVHLDFSSPWPLQGFLEKSKT